MFGKISKLVLAMGLIGGVMSGGCKAGEIEAIPQNVTMIIKSFTDSLEFRKPTRVFISLIGSLSTINPELNKLSSTSPLHANRQFFVALHQILSVPGFKVSDESVAAILKSAEEGCKDATEMVNATFGKKSSEITDRKAFLKNHMQEVLDESSSDSDDSSVDSEERWSRQVQDQISQISYTEIEISKFIEEAISKKIPEQRFEAIGLGEKAFWGSDALVDEFKKLQTVIKNKKDCNLLEAILSKRQSGDDEMANQILLWYETSPLAERKGHEIDCAIWASICAKLGLARGQEKFDRYSKCLGE